MKWQQQAKYNENEATERNFCHFFFVLKIVVMFPLRMCFFLALQMLAHGFLFD